jgi:RNA polymerase sigma-70 factor (ECF subfamily)
VLTSNSETAPLRARNTEALKTLVETHTTSLLATALGMGFSRPDADELVQSVFVAFLEAVDRFEERSKVKTFLFGILFNKASELRRHHVREQGTDKIEELLEARFDAKGMWLKPIQGPEETALTTELAAWIEECAQTLTTPQRAAFFMREVNGETTDDLCKILGVSVTHLGVILYRARHKLMLCLEEKQGKSL